LKGSTLRSRDAEYQQNLLQKFEELALPLLKEKKMKIEVHEVSIPLVNSTGCETDERCFLGTRFRMHTRRWKEIRIAERYVAADRRVCS